MFSRTRGAARYIALLSAMLLLALVVACGGSDSDEVPPASVTVTSGARTSHIEDNEFESPMRVAAGSEVTWVNEDGVAHNVIGKGSSFRSDTMQEGDTFTHTFDTPGRFEYTCAFHPGMDGVIEVE